MKIAILGAGAYGTAIGGILAEKGYDVDYYDARLEREKLAEVVEGAAVIVLAVPSSAAPYVLPHLPKEKPLLVATKGILSLGAFHGFSDVMVMSGPGFAEDIKARKKTLLTATDQRISELLETEFLKFDFTDDVNGVLECGALKNVYALGAGYKGLIAGSEEWEEYISRAVEEMRGILEFNGCEAETVELACGIDDLKLTCDFPSRNYEFGMKFHADFNYRPEGTVEGLSVLKRIERGEIDVPGTAVLLKAIQIAMKSVKD